MLILRKCGIIMEGSLQQKQPSIIVISATEDTVTTYG
jgi:hypothetical protein